MTSTDDKDKGNDVPPTDEQDTVTAEGTEETSEETVVSENEEAEAVEEEIDPKDAEIADLKEKLDIALRTAASSQNMAKRAAKELQDAKDFAITRFAKDLLPVADTFAEALKHAPEDPANDAEKVESFVKGVKSVHNVLLDAFNSHGVNMIEVVENETTLDPALHEAIAAYAAPEDKDVVVGVARDGYTIEGTDGPRVLRATQVAVSTGPE